MTRGSPGFRKLLLTTHVVFSVGWLGAAIAFLCLAIASLGSSDDQLVRALPRAMQTVAHYGLIPLSLGSFFSGLVQSLVTPWGLFLHYWVIVKLLINVVATGILLLYLRTLDHLAASARNAGTSLADLRDPSPAIHATAAIVLLVGATVLSVYKPRGMTRYGQRRQRREKAA